MDHKVVRLEIVEAQSLAREGDAGAGPSAPALFEAGGAAEEFGIGEEAFAIAKHLIDRHLIPRERGASQGGWPFGDLRWEWSRGRALRSVKVNR